MSDTDAVRKKKRVANLTTEIKTHFGDSTMAITIKFEDGTSLVDYSFTEPFTSDWLAKSLRNVASCLESDWIMYEREKK